MVFGRHSIFTLVDVLYCHHLFKKHLRNFDVKVYEAYKFSQFPQCLKGRKKSILQGKQFTIYGFECVLKTS